MRNERRARKEQSRFLASPRKMCEEWSGHEAGVERQRNGCVVVAE